jgi:PIN domain nuclease of toxin-antitoxin system
MTSASGAGYYLDASALLALLFQEPGLESVAAVLNHAYIHSVNLAEVAGKLVRAGVPLVEAVQAIEELDLRIDEDLPYRRAAACGALIAETRRQGLSLGDCICLTAAASKGCIAVTADRGWKKLHGRRIDGKEIRVQVIR